MSRAAFLSALVAAMLSTAAAATAWAGPAPDRVLTANRAAPEVRVDLRGKSPDAAHRDLTQAARAVCRRQHHEGPLALYLAHRCADASLERAVQAAAWPALTSVHARGAAADAPVLAAR